MEHFGASADYKTLFREFGFTLVHPRVPQRVMRNQTNGDVAGG